MHDKKRILLFIDVNENINKEKLRSAFTRFKLRDLVRYRTNSIGPRIHYNGMHQIDGTFASQDVDCSGASFLPFWAYIGDHRLVVVDIPVKSYLVKKCFVS